MSQGRPTLSGRYEVEGTLGEGGMATVFRGRDKVLGRTVAIKVLAPRYAGDQTFVERFRREAQAAARLNHPNVVGVFDTGSDNNIHYIVMEYVGGRTLAEILRTDGKLLPERAVEIAEAVAGALSFAHEHGLVHRDVKPANIMITPAGEVKVMDFGIARATTGETLTQTATVLGTASYLSPEQAQGEPVDARSDVYSLGVVLYEMLTGEPPFKGETAVAVAYKHVREDPVLPSRLEPGISSDLEAVVLKAMAKNPANRYQSAEEFRRDLERARHGAPVIATPVLPPDQTQVLTRESRDTMILPAPPMDEQERRSRKWIAGAIIALLVLLGLGAGLFILARNLLGGETLVEVPRVLNLPRKVAEELIEEAGLEVGDITFEASEERKGTVLEQDPEPGAQVDEGSSVDLVISGGPEKVEVPEIVGLSEADALIALEAAGLEAGLRTEEPSDEFEPGIVISQSPRAGQMAEEGSAVDYAVSTGPEAVTVPDVQCQTIDEAAEELGAVGLQISVSSETRHNPNCPGLEFVADQEPEPGAQAQKDDVVTVFPSEPLPTPTETSPSPEPTATETGG